MKRYLCAIFPIVLLLFSGCKLSFSDGKVLVVQEDAASSNDATETPLTITDYDACLNACAGACEKLNADVNNCIGICSLFDEGNPVEITCDEPVLTAAKKIPGLCYINSDGLSSIMIKYSLTCQTKISKSCSVDKAKCDAAYAILFDYIKSECGVKEDYPVLADYEACYAKAKAALIIPACQETCTEESIDLYSVVKEKLLALTPEEAKAAFLAALQSEPVCKIVPVETPAPEPEPEPEPKPEPVPQPKPEEPAFKAFIYTENPLYATEGDFTGFSTAISGGNQEGGFTCEWYKAAYEGASFELVLDHSGCGYIIPSASLDLNGTQYFFVAKDIDGKITKSNIATLYVKAKPAPVVLTGIATGIGKEWKMALGSGVGFTVWEVYSDGSVVYIEGRNDITMVIDNQEIVVDQPLNPGPQLNAIGVGQTMVHIYYKGIYEAPVLVTVY